MLYSNKWDQEYFSYHVYSTTNVNKYVLIKPMINNIAIEITKLHDVCPVNTHIRDN